MAVPTDRNFARNCFVPVMSGLLVASAGAGLTYGASEIVKYLQKDVCQAIFDPSCVTGSCLNKALKDCNTRFKFVPASTYAFGAALSILLAVSTSCLVRRCYRRGEEGLLPSVGVAVDTRAAKRAGVVHAFSLVAAGIVAFGISIGLQGSTCDSTCRTASCSFDDKCVVWVTYSCAHDCKTQSAVILSACMPIFLSLGAAILYGYCHYKYAVLS